MTLRIISLLVLFSLAGCSGGGGRDTPAPNNSGPVSLPGVFLLTGSMQTGRVFHTATLLTSGKVLITGGTNDLGGSGAEAATSAEIFDPSTGSSTPAGKLGIARQNHVALLLPNGKVLLAGGQVNTAPSTELFDPVSGTSTSTSLMNKNRNSVTRFTATVLQNGKTLITGGYIPGSDPNEAFRACEELYDPATNVFSPTGALIVPRDWHCATRLNDGRVLITGGSNNGDPVQSSAELYDPSTGTFTATGSMKTARMNHSSTLLPNGKVLITGGFNDRESYGTLASSELFDPSTGIFSTCMALMVPRQDHTATLLPNGKVLIAGGMLLSGSTLQAVQFPAEIFDPATEKFSPTGSMVQARGFATATQHASGKILFLGGTSMWGVGFYSTLKSGEEFQQ